MAEQNIDFRLLWDEACRAAQTAAEGQYAKLGDCPDAEHGSAWLTIPRSLPFGRWATRWATCWATQEEIDSDQGVLEIWDAEFHHVYTPVLSVYEAAAIAARNVLNGGLQTRSIGVGTVRDRVFDRVTDGAIRMAGPAICRMVLRAWRYLVSARSAGPLGGAAQRTAPEEKPS